MNKKNLVVLAILLFTSCNIIEEVKPYEVVVIENRITRKALIKSRPGAFISLFKKVERYSVKPLRISFWGLEPEDITQNNLPPIQVTFKDEVTAEISFATILSFPREPEEVIAIYKDFNNREVMVTKITEAFKELTITTAKDFTAIESYNTPNFWITLEERISIQGENKGFTLNPMLSSRHIRYEEIFRDSIKKQLLEEAERIKNKT